MIKKAPILYILRIGATTSLNTKIGIIPPFCVFDPDRTFLQFQALEFRRSTFLKYLKFVDRRIIILRIGVKVRQVLQALFVRWLIIERSIILCFMFMLIQSNWHETEREREMAEDKIK